MLFSTLCTFLFALSAAGAAAADRSSRHGELGSRHARRNQHRSVSRFVHRDKKLRKRQSSSSCQAPLLSSDTTVGSNNVYASNNTANTPATPSGSAPAPTSTASSNAGGMLSLDDPTCGSNHPTATTTKSSGPNGSQDWFNCGVNSPGGWTPPMLKVDQLISVSWETALAQNQGVFQACEPYIDSFKSAAEQYNIPLMLMVAVAIEESSCNPSATSPGDNPTKGLFQLDSSNCPQDSDCYDADANTQAAAVFMNTLLSQNDGNVLMMNAYYNGWYKHMTAGDVSSQPCDAQQNLNYMQQIYNGYMQGLDGSQTGDVQTC